MAANMMLIAHGEASVKKITLGSRSLMPFVG